jgi:hypothetical protein
MDWNRAAFVVGLAAGAGALWLKYKHGMDMQQAAVAMLGVVGGPYAILCSLCCSEEWLRTNEKTKRIVEKVGEGLTRLLHFVLGLALIGVGAWFLWDYFGDH